MNKWTIAIVAEPGHEDAAERVRRQLHDAWDVVPVAIFETVELGQLDESYYERLDAAIFLVNDATSHPHLLGPLAALEEVHTPVMALLETAPHPGSVFEASGVMIEDRTADGGTLAARLHGMLHRQREIDRLWRDVAIGRRTYRGLRGEVDKMHEELHLAARAQRDFLPQSLPVLNGVSVATLWRPAHYVSGDIYEVARLDEDHLCLFIADAVGHGLSAALMTMVILQSLQPKEIRGQSWRLIPPAEVMSHLNAQLIRHKGATTRFATGVYALVNCRDRTMTVAGAGHPPPLLMHENGNCDSLETSGGLLGVFADECYDEVTVELEVGDRLLIFSDGFELAFTDPEEDGRDVQLPSLRYREAFEQLCGTGTPEEIVEAVGRRLDTQSGSLHQIDDLTLLCMLAGPLVTTDTFELSESAAA